MSTKDAFCGTCRKEFITVIYAKGHPVNCPYCGSSDRVAVSAK